MVAIEAHGNNRNHSERRTNVLRSSGLCHCFPPEPGGGRVKLRLKEREGMFATVRLFAVDDGRGRGAMDNAARRGLPFKHGLKDAATGGIVPAASESACSVGIKESGEA